MTIRTMCDVCGRVVRYTDGRQQEMEAMTDPDQFCDCPPPGPCKWWETLPDGVHGRCLHPDNSTEEPCILNNGDECILREEA